MRVRLRRHPKGHSTGASQRTRRGGSGTHVRSTPEPAPPRDSGQDRERRSGGPQDRALYICRCGSAFSAPVTASVTCPHCGDAQAW